MNKSLRTELINMSVEDQRVREELAADGSLFEGYHPRMLEVHQRNGKRLEEVIDEYGWPGKSLVGQDGAEAAWLILQHDISNPALQRRCLALLEAAARAGEIPLWQPAYLLDRIRSNEGKPQVYGIQFDWDEHGEMSPLPIADIEQVDERRAVVGLGPLEEEVRKRRAVVAQSNEKPPTDWRVRQRAIEEWARSVGWRN